MDQLSDQTFASRPRGTEPSSDGDGGGPGGQMGDPPPPPPPTSFAPELYMWPGGSQLGQILPSLIHN